MTEIVKVQIPIVPKGGPAMVYAKDRVEVLRVKLDAATRKAMKGDRVGYFVCSWSKAGAPKLGRRITRFKSWR